MKYSVVYYSLENYRIKRVYARNLDTRREAKDLSQLAEESPRFSCTEEGVGIVEHEEGVYPMGEYKGD